jgi:hypothetical protein
LPGKTKHGCRQEIGQMTLSQWEKAFPMMIPAKPYLTKKPLAAGRSPPALRQTTSL